MRNNTKKIRDTRRRNGDAQPASARSGRRSLKTDRRPADANGAGNARKCHERYLALARTAETTEDAAGIENLYQHAEHYFRLMREQAV